MNNMKYGVNMQCKIKVVWGKWHYNDTQITLQETSPVKTIKRPLHTILYTNDTLLMIQTVFLLMQLLWVGMIVTQISSKLFLRGSSSTSFRRFPFSSFMALHQWCNFLGLLQFKTNINNVWYWYCTEKNYK